MTKCRKALSLLLTILMVFSLFPMMVSADETGTGSTKPVWPEEGSIKLDKNANAVEGAENLWEIVLSIQGKNYKTTSDVVLVIDCSGSMEGSKLTNTRAAAKAFGQKLLTKDSSTRIAIVTYVDTATAYNNGHFYTADELSDFEMAVDAATYANGGTNQQAGIHVAQELLRSDASTGKLKNIVILSDGEPTYSYPFIKKDIYYGNCKNWKHKSYNFHEGGNYWNWDEVTKNVVYNEMQPLYDVIIGEGNSFEIINNYMYYEEFRHCKHGYYNLTGNNSDLELSENGELSLIPAGGNHGTSTIWEANQAKAAGTTIFSVALQAGTNGENTLKACATDANSGYYAIGKNDNVEEKLTSAFTAIAGSIAIAASQGSVTDPMGDMVQLAFSGTAPVITTDEAVYNAGNADVYISQGNATFENGTIHWNVGDVREGVNPTMRYKITIIPDEKINTGDVLEANGRTTFNYKNYKDEETTAEFPIPEITVGGGNIRVHYYMVNGNGQPINESGVVVDSPSLAKQVKEAEYLSVNGSTGLSYNTPYTVEKENIADYTYYGSYNLNNGALTEGNAAAVTLTAANSNQHVWFAYTQGFNVVHVQNGVGIRTDAYTIGQEVAGIYEEGLFNLTAAVTDGYLYGGTFTFERDNYTTVHHEFTGNNAKNPMSFRPTAGETYYIWEVDQAYLVPKSLSLWHHVTSNEVDVMGFFLITPIDREYYNKVGFNVNGTDIDATQVTKEYYEGFESVVIENIAPVVYESLQLRYKNGYGNYSLKDFMSSDFMEKNPNAKGYLGCVSVDKAAYWNASGDSFEVVPYWVTLDGVKVTSATTRNCTYNGQGTDTDSNNSYKKIVMDSGRDTGIIMEYVAGKNVDTNSIMMVYSAFVAAPVVSNNVEPVEPEKPEEPKDNTITVTIHDNENVYDLELLPGDISSEIKYNGTVGYLFSGWYTDEAYVKSVDFTNVTEDITIYAKYVSDSYLRLSYEEQRSYSNWKRTLTLSTTVAEGDFREIGFLVNGNICVAKDRKNYGYGDRFKSKYDSSYNFVYAFGFGFGYPAFGEMPVDMERTLTYDLSVKRGETYDITPYWITMDGTTVYGESRTLTIVKNGVKE